MGTLDFAGGTVVHISSGTAAFTAAVILGPRTGWQTSKQHKPANIPFTCLGATMLWFGWIGFNAGSAGAANGLAGLALVNTNVAAASALMTWVLLESVTGNKKPSLVGASIGCVVGLVAITPAAGFVQPGWGTLIGILGSMGVFGALRLKHYLRTDDTLDVFLTHGVGGMIGCICTGLFAQADVNQSGANNGAFYGHPYQLVLQLFGILTAIGLSSFTTAASLLLLKYTIGIRVSAEMEIDGPDHYMHGEQWMFTIHDVTSGKDNGEVTIALGGSAFDPACFENGSERGLTDERSSFAKLDCGCTVEKSSLEQDFEKFPSAPVKCSIHGSTIIVQPKKSVINNANLAQTVATLVQQMALPGHTYDIGLSRSC